MKIFVCSTGRCGTAFFKGVFERSTPIPSFHEPFPRGIGRVCEEVNNYEYLSYEVEQVLRAKVRFIRLNQKDGWYFESSQMFIKTFVWEILESFDDVACIFLFRNPLEVLLSYQATQGEGKPIDWFLKAEWRRNILRMEGITSWAETILWNWFEVKARFFHFREKFKKSYVFNFKKINDPLEWRRLFEYFEIPYSRIELSNIWRGERKQKISNSELLLRLIQEWDEIGKFGGFNEDFEEVRKWQNVISR
jgi:hypothetical protein